MLSLVTAIVKPHKLMEVREALDEVGVHGPHHQRGEGLRPPGRAHRDLPGRRVLHRLRAEGEDRGAGPHQRCREDRRRDRRGPPSRAGSVTARSGSRRSCRPCASAPASRASTPSEPAGGRSGGVVGQRAEVADGDAHDAVEELLVGRAGPGEPHDADEVALADEDEVALLDGAVGRARPRPSGPGCRPTARRSRARRCAATGPRRRRRRRRSPRRCPG